MKSHAPPPPLPPGPARDSSCSDAGSVATVSDLRPSKYTLIRPEQLLVVTRPSRLLISSIKSRIGASTEPFGDRS
jgi:hypothetical protein